MADNSDKIALLNQLLQNGQITQDMFDENVGKLTTLKTNLRPEMPGRASSLSGVMDEIRNRGVGTQNIMNEVKTALPGSASVTGRTAALETLGSLADDMPKNKGTSLGRLNGRFGKTLKALGILGPAAAALSISDKAMAGDFGQAGLEAADVATDYVPGLGEVKMAIRPEEAGNAELPADEMRARAIFNEQARKGKMGEPTRHPSFVEESLEIEEPTRLDDMNSQIRGRFNTLNRMK